jgi:hypothetical protein
MSTILAGHNAPADRLSILAASINDHHRAANAATRRGLEHAIAAGALLLEAKELVAHHGEWLPWLQANCEVGPRQAQTYMRLARNRHKLDAIKNESSAHLTIAAAEALVGRPRPERPHGLPGQFDLLGGSEVIARPKGPALRGRALFDLIVDLEQALAIIGDLERTRQSETRRCKLRWAADRIAGAIVSLKSHHKVRS